MDSSVRNDQESSAHQDLKKFLVGLTLLTTSIIKWLAGLIQLTEEEQEEAGIYIDRLGGE